MAVSATHNGWRWDRANTRLDFYYRGTRAGDITATGLNVTGILAVAGAATVTGAFTASAGATVTGALAVSTTATVTGLLTASAAATVTTGNLTTTAGDNRVTAGNVRLGAVSAFATTEPTSWIVFKAGTQPAGAITTSSGLGANATTVQKIIAAGTINNVET